MLIFDSVKSPSTPENDPAADFDDPLLNVRNMYCTEHEIVEDQLRATYYAHGRWLQPGQDRTIETTALVEVLVEHLARDHEALTQEQVDAVSSLAGLGTPPEALRLLMEFPAPTGD